MTIESIIKSVRLCFDEYSTTNDFEDTSMDEIIKDKIGDAQRWICLYSPSQLLGKSGTTITGALIDKEETAKADGIMQITLPPDYLRLVRVRVSGWNKAVMEPISEDSGEYLQWNDELSAPTKDRPSAAIIEKSQKILEVNPVSSGDKVEYTYITDLSSSDSSSETTTDVTIPAKTETSFIYYLAFLVLSAYGDARAERMYQIAKENLARES